MARLQLGSIVTRISGSVGGTTFRRVGSIDVISNKSYGGSRNKLLSNASLLALRSVTQSWFMLSTADRSNYESFASRTLVPDSFGGFKYLTGRQMFIKLQTVKNRTNNKFIDTNALDTYNDNFIVDEIIIDSSSGEAFLTVSNIFSDTFFFIQFEIVKSFASMPSFTRRKNWFVGFSSVASYFSIWSQLTQQIPQITPGMLIRCYVSVCNSSGYVTPPVVVDITVL
jgi:hypothetical protein